MKRLLVSFVSLIGLGGISSFITWQAIGPPDRSVECNQDELPENFVCLSTVKEWDEADILWIDARARSDWKKNGLEGSVLLNDQEEWLDQEPSFMKEMIISSPKSKVVVYCNQSGCGSSKYVANQLRDRHSEMLGFQVYVLEGGVKAILAERM